MSLVHESPRWLLRSGQNKKALLVLQKIHQTNFSLRETKSQLEADLSAEPQPVDPGRLSATEALTRNLVDNLFKAWPK